MTVLNPASFTFTVDDVAPATTPLPETAYLDAVKTVLDDTQGNGLESCSRAGKTLVKWENSRRANQYGHGFVRTVNQAYDDHRPLVLSPDMIWLLIAQGVAQHVAANAERLRHRFVAHDGKLLLQVERNKFVKGFADNDWEGVFAEWSAQIRTHVGPEVHGLLVQKFSTTSIVEQAAMEITLLDAFKSYFDYLLVTRCGIPAITLEGTSDDWEQIYAAAGRLAEYDLDWWTPRLCPVLKEFVNASQGHVNRSFWQEFYKRRDGSGGPYINGHLVAFFPYLLNNDRVPMPNQDWARVHPGRLPNGLSLAPFDWRYHGTSYPMQLVAGFVGTAQDTETWALRPEIGWAVRDALSAKTISLIRAAELSHTELVQELLTEGTSVNAQDKDGNTALMFAAEGGQTEIVRLLLDNGANADLMNSAGETARDWAKRRLPLAIEREKMYRRGLVTWSESGDPQAWREIIQMLGA